VSGVSINPYEHDEWLSLVDGVEMITTLLYSKHSDILLRAKELPQTRKFESLLRHQKHLEIIDSKVPQQTEFGGSSFMFDTRCVFLLLPRMAAAVNANDELTAFRVQLH
jgi:hypothetical protein